MPAQLIVAPKAAAVKPAGKSKIAAEEAKKESGLAAKGTKAGKRRKKPDKDKDPPFIQTPVGALVVFGQKPLWMGHFADVATLLDRVHAHARKQLPGGSNTLFAGVTNLDDVQSSWVQDKLNILPEKLTIVVHEAKRYG